MNQIRFHTKFRMFPEKHRRHFHLRIPFLSFTKILWVCHSPVLEEGLQGLADGVSLLECEKVLKLLAEGSTLYANTGRQDLSNPLKGAKHGTTGARRNLHLFGFGHGEGRRAIFNHQAGHCPTPLQHGHHLLM